MDFFPVWLPSVTGYLKSTCSGPNDPISLGSRPPDLGPLWPVWGLAALPSTLPQSRLTQPRSNHAILQLKKPSPGPFSHRAGGTEDRWQSNPCLPSQARGPLEPTPATGPLLSTTLHPCSSCLWHCCPLSLGSCSPVPHPKIIISSFFRILPVENVLTHQTSSSRKYPSLFPQVLEHFVCYVAVNCCMPL